MRSYLTTLIKQYLHIMLITVLAMATLHGLSAYYFPRVSSIQRIKTLPLLGDVTRKGPNLYDGVVILTDEDGKGFCSGSVIDNNYVVTAAHCLVDGDGKLNGKALNVRTSSGQLIQVSAKAAAANTRVDVGLVLGDFKDFQFMPIDYRQVRDFAPTENPFLKMLQGLSGKHSDTPAEGLEQAMACGYPEAQASLTCIPVRDIKYYEFQLIGQGQLFPGMSGGPVFVMTPEGPKIIAVNTAITFESNRNIVILSPVLGLQGEFDIY